MNIKAIASFLIVAEELSFRSAAARLGISQPAVTNRIAALENELGFDLIIRDKQRMLSLTSAGQAYLTHARSALAKIDHAHHIARTIDDKGVPPIRIGLCESRNVGGTRTAISRLVADLPHRSFHFLEASSYELIEALLNDELDLIFSAMETGNALLSFERLCEDRWLAVMPNHHPLANRASLSATDLRDEPLVLPEPVAGELDPIILAFHDAEVAPRVALQFVRRTTMFTVVAAGFGIGFAPASYAKMVLPGLAMLPFDAAPSGAYLAWGKTHAQVLAEPLAIIREAVAAG